LEAARVDDASPSGIDAPALGREKLSVSFSLSICGSAAD